MHGKPVCTAGVPPDQAARGVPGIQALRALAALAVAFLHIADEAGALVGTPGHAPYRIVDALPLAAGVDLFFVISGFVMTWVCWPRFGKSGVVGPFVARRLLRIVPLYWLLTAVTVLAALVVPGLVSDGLGDGWGYVAASFGFIPWRRADGFVQPMLRLGWTLEYEMLFYGLVACCLKLRPVKGVAVMLAGIAALALAGAAVPPGPTPLVFWTDPIVLEFGLGVLAAIPALRGGRTGWAVAAFALAVVAAAVCGPADRVVAWGVPSALLTVWALSWRSVPGWLVLLGDASYALYLVHPFPMRAMRIVVGRLAMPSAIAVPAYLAATLAACIACAILLHRLFERPILRWGQRRTWRADVAAIRE